MATPATYTSRMGESPSPGRGGSSRRLRRCPPGTAGRRRSSSRPTCRSGGARDRARRRSGSSAPTRPRAGRRRRPRTAPGPRAWTGARSTRPRASPRVTAGSPRTAPRRYTGSTRAARPGRPPRTACSAGQPGRARPRRADGGRERSDGGRAARWSRRRSRASRSIARRPLSSASVLSARWLYCERRSGACGGRARSSLLPAAAARDAPRVLGYASSVVAALARLGSRLDALPTSHLADSTLVRRLALGAALLAAACSALPVPRRAGYHAADADLSVTRIVHGAVILELGGTRLLVDPWFHSGFIVRQREPLGLTPEGLPSFTAVLLTHRHGDHFDETALARLAATVPTVVARPELHARLIELGFRRVVDLGWWDGVSLDGVTLTAVPARHGAPENGYVVEGGRVQVYVAGDTRYFPELVDVATRFPHPDAG